MTILGNILLGFAFFLYLVPLQVLLRKPIVITGNDSVGVVLFLFVTVPFWLTLFLSWCILFSRDRFDWLGGGRGWQFSVLFLTWLALTVVTSLAAMLRGDPQVPWALRPLMPWGIYLLPLAAIIATLLMFNPSLGAAVPALATRLTLGLCGALALASSFGMIVQSIVSAQRKATAAIVRDAESQEINIRGIVAEVEVLDPIKDLGPLLRHAASSGFEAPRQLAQKKISAYPHLQEELALRLTNQWSVEALGYLELNDPPDAAALAVPVRTALESLTPWINRELERSTSFWPETYYSETKMALAVADKFAPYGIDYVPAVRALRAAFDHPNARNAKLEAPRLIDTWLAKYLSAANRHPVSPRR